ncbi:uncharacterized protein N7503_000928 [Penicillium pulvis]|uniref:uncharacterized protein n=1 Tax=Penicillium pulvis TaxID=1562058 RepID=UPI002549B9F5|nr:uncharacterized protein N7503_000928 [Penicillium pulvis]KAJ5814178.1 hypothetical protein N7503_000928 [Penicillium pulvis]
MPQTKILLTGATGYIGGTVLSTLLSSTNEMVKASKLSAIVRKQSQADLLSEKGVNAILFDGLDDLQALRKAASEHDIVINVAITYHTASAEALLRGLDDRQKKTGKLGHLIQTSGTSNIADKPFSGGYVESAVLSDKNDIYAYERYRQSIEVYPQRTSDLLVCEQGEAAGIKTYVIMPPTIYGEGTGFFNRRSIQINTMMRAALKDGYASRVGAGEAEWDHVHVVDLANFYELMVARILAGDDLEANLNGIYFCQSGHQSWREVAERIAEVGHALGYLKSYTVRQITLQQASEKFGAGLPAENLEAAYASRARSSADRAHELGWRPTKSRKDFEDGFVDEWNAVAKEA